LFHGSLQMLIVDKSVLIAAIYLGSSGMQKVLVNMWRSHGTRGCAKD